MSRPRPHVRRHLVSADRLHVGESGRITRTTAPSSPVLPGRDTTAFVLQGGGSLTATQVGALRALTEAGIRPDFVIGSSAGALNAVMFAADPTLAGLDRLAGLWKHLRRRTVAPLSPLALARAVSGHGSSLVTDRGLRDLLLSHLSITEFEDTLVPALVVATDLASCEPVVLQHGSVVDALLASSAFPGLYPPVAIAGRALVDGGVSADTPVLQAEHHGATVCYVLPCAAQSTRADHRPGALPLAYHALAQIVDLNSRHDIAAATSTVHVLPAPASSAAHPVDFRDTDELIARSYQLARAELALLPVGAVRAGA